MSSMRTLAGASGPQVRSSTRHARHCAAAQRPTRKIAGSSSSGRAVLASAAADGERPALSASALCTRVASAALAAWCLLAPLPGAQAAAEGGVLAATAVAVEAPLQVPGGAAGASVPQTVYFGNGCFWGRQKDFVDVETQQLGRQPERLTALVGYAAGTRVGPGGKVCYVYSDPRTHYDALGHAEVVQLGISADPGAGEAELRAFSKKYFEQFRRTPAGMMRSDPQDRGAAYRNVIGIPGGVSSPLYRVIQEENKYGMELREGRGNVVQSGKDTEDDVFNAVWVVDSDSLPFYRAEKYHQFHNGLGKRFPAEYLRDLRNQLAGLGRIEPTGCPELLGF